MCRWKASTEGQSACLSTYLKRRPCRTNSCRTTKRIAALGFRPRSSTGSRGAWTGTEDLDGVLIAPCPTVSDYARLLRDELGAARLRATSDNPVAPTK